MEIPLITKKPLRPTILQHSSFTIYLTLEKLVLHPFSQNGPRLTSPGIMTQSMNCWSFIEKKKRDDQR